MPKNHRLHIILEEDLFNEWNETIQWGLRQHIVIAVMKMLIAAVQKEGPMFLGAVMSGKYKLVFDDGKEE